MPPTAITREDLMESLKCIADWCNFIHDALEHTHHPINIQSPPGVGGMATKIKNCFCPDDGSNP